MSSKNEGMGMRTARVKPVVRMRSCGNIRDEVYKLGCG